MKKSFSKLLGILLALCMIFSICPIAVFAEETAVTTEYYVQAGAASTNDGRSASAPAASLGTVIASINADGHKAGDNVTVYVMKAADEITTYSQDDIDKGNIKFIGFETNAAHEATITYTSYDPNNRSTLLFKAGYAMSGTSHSTHINLKGPTNFENINLTDTRADTAAFNIYCYGFDCTFRDTYFYRIKKIDATDTTPAMIALNETKWNSHFQLGGYNNNTPIGDGGTIVIEDNLAQLQNLRISGSASKGQASTVKSLFYSGDVTAKIGNGTKQTLNSIQFDVSGEASLFTTYEKNINIVADNVTVSKVSNSTSTGAVVKGAVQIILNNGSTIPATLPAIYKNSAKTTAADIYKITAPAGVTLDVTANAGKYTVSGDKVAYVVSPDGKTVNYSVGGVVSVGAPGTYTVLAADSLDAVKAALSVPDGDGEFDGWDDSVSGVLTAKFTGGEGGNEGGEGETPTPEENPKYYVKWNGSGNGLSASSPVATVKDAVTLINAAGYGADDTVEIYIMNDDTLTADQTAGKASSDPWMYDKDGNYLGNLATKGAKLKARQTAWATEGASAGTYAATLVIKGYTSDAKLFQSEIVGLNTNITLGGATIFEDLAIVTTRSVDREIFLNGKNATFNNVSFMYQVADNSSGSTKYGGLGNGHLRLSPSGAGTSGTIPGSTVVFNTPVPSENDNRYGAVVAGTKAYTYSSHMKYYFNGASVNGAIGWAQAASIFNDGLSLVVNAGSYVPKVRTDATLYTATVNGGLQVVFNNGTTPFTLPADYVNADGIWYMASADTTGNKLDVTDTAGTFEVIGGKTAWATDEDGYSFVSVDGLLTVPAGNYTVTYDNSDVQTTGTLYLDGEEYAQFVPGTVVALPDRDDKPGVVFLGWGREGDIFTDKYQTAKTDTAVYLTSQYETLANTCVYYVDSAKGNDGNEGTSESAPLATINAAITKADANTNANKLVVVIGTFYIEKNDKTTRDFATHTNMIKIIGDGTGNSVIRKEDTITINGPTTFEDIAFVNIINSKHIDAVENELVIGKNVTFTPEGSFSKNFDIHSGKMNGISTGRTNVTISSPINLLYVGTYYNNIARSFAGGDYYINSTVANLALMADGWASGTSIFNLPSIYDGVSNFYINEGANVAKITSDAARVQYNEKTGFNFFLNGGKIGAIAEAVVPYAYVIDTANFTATEYISGADAPATFNVSGTKTALATHSSGAQYVSADGVLTLGQAGSYTVEFVEDVYYTNSGIEIEFYKDMALDLSTAMHSEFDGKLFVGWTYENGDIPETSEFKTGDILVANYVELNLDENFYIEGAQIRTSGTPGLRFIVRKMDAMDELLPEIQSFGTVVIPSSVLYDFPTYTQHELELDTVYTYNSKKYTSADVVAEKLYKKLENGVNYTAVITGLTENHYATMYTVKGYIKYKDYNGFDKILYSDYYATNYVNVADMAIRMSDSGELPITPEQKEYYSGIINTAKSLLATEFAGTVKTVGGSADDPNSFKHVYELGTSGVQVRDVNIYPADYVEGETDREPVVVMQLSDVHFNYVSDEDFAEANPSVMSTYQGRTAFRNTVPAAQRTLRYAYSQTDNIVITGDILDFISRGAMELTNKHIFDVYPQVMAALGNHDGTRICQQPADNKVPDPTTLESRLELVQDNWNGNVYYESRVIEDRVMAIYLDDGTASRFWDVQVEPLTRDLALAREKGYTVLLFFHIPLRTYNPNETAVDQLPNSTGRSDNSGVRNFTTEGIHQSANDATNAVFQLIKDYDDVIYGMFTGHTHSPYYSEFVTETDPDTGAITAVIPQYTMTATAYSSGNATKIIIH